MSSEVAVPDQAMVGLEDFDPTKDAVMPTIKIDHQNGVFLDSLSGASYDELDVVLLGNIKQRVLWDSEVQENPGAPWCQSYDFEVGLPDQKEFPWNFKTDKHTMPFTPGMEKLSCEQCPLKDWGTHPKRDAPWCSEQHSFALMQPIGDGFAPALLTLQRSALKASNTYMTNFFRAQTPLFTVRTTLTLDHRKRGTNEYAVPIFKQGPATDAELWPVFADNYISIRNLIQTPRTPGSEEDAGNLAAPASAPASAGPTTAEGPASTGAPVSDDDLPF